MKTLENKVVVITGAGSGIGRALSIAASKQGARLAISDRDEKSLAETASLAGGKVLSRTVDVREDKQVEGFASAVAEELGGANVIVNNAGVSLSDTVGRMKREDFQWVMDINFWGVVRGTEAFLPQLREKDDAHIVNISSIFGAIGVPSQSAYNASKFAVRGFTESLAQELHGSSVHVSCVLPGGVKTNITRGGRHNINMYGDPCDTATLSTEFDKIARLTPDQAAAIIWRGVLHNEARILVGNDARLLDAIQRFLPGSYPNVLRLALKAGEKQLRGAAALTGTVAKRITR